MNKKSLTAAVGATLAAGAFASLPAGAQALGNYTGDLIVSSSTYTDPGFGVGYALPNSGGVTAVNSSAATPGSSTTPCAVR